MTATWHAHHHLVVVGLIGLLLGGTLLGCAMSPAAREAAVEAWAERDAARARECQQARGRWIAGGCVLGGGA